MKKFLATLVMGAVAVSSAFGFSACIGDVSIAKGESVTKDGWTKAFEKTEDLENCTLNVSVKSKAVVSGTAYNYNYYTDKSTEQEVSSTATISGSQTLLYDKTNNKAYSEYSRKTDADGKTDGEKEFSNYKSSAKNYYELSEEKDGYKRYWHAGYSSEESKSSEGRGSEEKYWNATETSYFESNLLSNIFYENFIYEYDSNNTLNNKYGKLEDLYDQFTYSDGLYTATMYKSISIYNGIYETLKCNVTLSFKDGYVIGYGVKTEGEGDLEKKDMYKLTYSYSAESVYAVSNIGNTDVSKKVNKDITKALDKAKAEKEKNK